MQAVFIVINEPDMLQDVLTGLLEEGITRATIVESHGMGRAVMDRLSIFAGFRDLWKGNLGYNFTLFVAIEDKMVEPLIETIQDILSTNKSKSKGVLFTIPISHFVKLSD